MIWEIVKIWRRLKRREDGNSTIQFVILFPALITLFFATFEVSMIKIRQVSLERAVDITVRDLRLGKLSDVEPADLQNELRTRICGNSSILPDCMTSLLIELRPVSTTTWEPLGSDVTCKERSEPIDPVVELELGAAHELMLVRVCAVIEPMFPTTQLGIQLHIAELGGYAIVASSAFVNEPS